MAAATSAPAPHSRWLLRQQVGRLAAIHARVAAAIAALDSATEARQVRVRTRGRPPLRQRMAARRDWPQLSWFILVLVATALFLMWVSLRLVAHLAPLPVFAAVAPGLLLAAAMGGAARYVTHSAKRLRELDLPAVVLPSLPLLAASAGAITWIALWLVLTSGTPAWSAVIFAAAATVAAAVAMVTCSYLGGPPPDHLPPTADVPARRQFSRLMRVRHRRASKRLAGYRGRWMTAAHHCAAVVAGTGRAEEILAGLLAGAGARLELGDVDPYSVMILESLRSFHPAQLTADLDAATARMSGDEL